MSLHIGVTECEVARQTVDEVGDAAVQNRPLRLGFPWRISLSSDNVSGTRAIAWEGSLPSASTTGPPHYTTVKINCLNVSAHNALTCAKLPTAVLFLFIPLGIAVGVIVTRR